MYKGQVTSVERVYEDMPGTARVGDRVRIALRVEMTLSEEKLKSFIQSVGICSPIVDIVPSSYEEKNEQSPKRNVDRPSSAKDFW